MNKKDERMEGWELTKLMLSFFWDKDFLIGALYCVGILLIVYLVGIFV